MGGVVFLFVVFLLYLLSFYLIVFFKFSRHMIDKHLKFLLYLLNFYLHLDLLLMEFIIQIQNLCCCCFLFVGDFYPLYCSFM